MDNIGVETAAFPGQKEEEIDRLLHMVNSHIFSHKNLELIFS